MAECLIAMNAPNGECHVDLGTSSDLVFFDDFHWVAGDPDKWQSVSFGPRHIVAKNRDAAQHLWVAFVLNEGQINNGGGSMSIRVEGNGDAAFMWCEVNGQRRGAVHTNPATGHPRQMVVYTWFTFGFESLPKVHAKYLEGGRKRAHSE